MYICLYILIRIFAQTPAAAVFAKHHELRSRGIEWGGNSICQQQKQQRSCLVCDARLSFVCVCVDVCLFVHPYMCVCALA